MIKKDPRIYWWESYASHIQIDYRVWTYFYWRLFKKYVRFQSFAVLDFGCGTGLGTICWKMFPGVRNVVGVDKDAAQLAIAHSRGVEAHTSVKSLKIQKSKFQLVVSYNDVVNHFHPDKVRSDFFMSVFDMLERGGVFIFDFLTPEKHSVANVPPVQFDGWRISQKTIADEKIYASSGGSLKREKEMSFKKINISFFQQNKKVRSITEYLFPLSFIKQQALLTGFKKVTFHHMLVEHPLKSTNSKHTRVVCVAVV